MSEEHDNEAKSKDSKEEIQPSEAPQKRPRSNTVQRIFVAAIIVAICIVIPYAYFALWINIYAHTSGEMPAGFTFPVYWKFGITLTSCVCFHVLKRLTRFALHRPIMRCVPTKDSEGEEVSAEKKAEVAEKLKGHAFAILYYTSSSVTAWVLCKDQEWMPWYLGGQGAI